MLRLAQSRSMIVQDNELIGVEGERGISAPFVIRELDLVHVGGERLDNRADLAASQAALGQVGQKCDNIVESNRLGHASTFSNNIAACQPRNVLAVPDDPRAADKRPSCGPLHIKV
jgi:hypothetical protein